MSDTVKLIIEIPKEVKADIDNGVIRRNIDKIYLALANGMPLDTVKAEIETDLSFDMFDEYGNETRLHKDLMEILANIGRK